MDEILYYCALNRIFGFKPKIAHCLLDTFKSPKRIFEMSEDEKTEILGPFSEYSHKIDENILEECAKELNSLKDTGIRFISINDTNYPALLKECPDAPVGLYTKGNLPDSGKTMIAIVGTRDISSYGTECCSKIVEALSLCEEKPVIISGLALGTDVTAHTAAIENGLPTIAVMATGPEKIYPLRHRGMAKKICSLPESGLITDYPPGTVPMAINFIRRNRIIAGMSRATILIESKIKGGGMITGKLAFEYDRDVYALPGRIDDIRSQGCNYLIRNETAVPITSIDNLIRNLRLTSGRKPQKGRIPDLKALYKSWNPEDIRLMSDILLTIRQNRSISIEDISRRTGSDYKTAARLTARLESDGIITSDILNRFMINTKKM